jgi:transketolase
MKFKLGLKAVAVSGVVFFSLALGSGVAMGALPTNDDEKKRLNAEELMNVSSKVAIAKLDKYCGETKKEYDRCVTEEQGLRNEWRSKMDRANRIENKIGDYLSDIFTARSNREVDDLLDTIKNRAQEAINCRNEATLKLTEANNARDKFFGLANHMRHLTTEARGHGMHLKDPVDEVNEINNAMDLRSDKIFKEDEKRREEHAKENKRADDTAKEWEREWQDTLRKANRKAEQARERLASSSSRNFSPDTSSSSPSFSSSSSSSSPSSSSSRIFNPIPSYPSPSSNSSSSSFGFNFPSSRLAEFSSAVQMAIQDAQALQRTAIASSASGNISPRMRSLTSDAWDNVLTIMKSNGMPSNQLTADIEQFVRDVRQ